MLHRCRALSRSSAAVAMSESQDWSSGVSAITAIRASRRAFPMMFLGMSRDTFEEDGPEGGPLLEESWSSSDNVLCSAPGDGPEPGGGSNSSSDRAGEESAVWITPSRISFLRSSWAIASCRRVVRLNGLAVEMTWRASQAEKARPDRV